MSLDRLGVFYVFLMSLHVCHDCLIIEVALNMSPLPPTPGHLNISWKIIVPHDLFFIGLHVRNSLRF